MTGYSESDELTFLALVCSVCAKYDQGNITPAAVIGGDSHTRRCRRRPQVLDSLASLVSQSSKQAVAVGAIPPQAGGLFLRVH
jgi:hypothetical protein